MKFHVLQFNMNWCKKEENFKKVESLLKFASLEPFDFLVLPEMFATGFVHHPEASLAENFSESSSETSQFLSALAKKYQIFIQGGGISAFSENKYYNTTGIYSPKDVSEIPFYNKIHLFFSEKKHFACGTELKNISVDGFHIFPLTCYDLRFPELFRKALSEKANLFTVSASWPEERIVHWDILLQGRAIENQSYVIGANRVGNDPYASYIGHSKIISPEGIILADAKEEECVISAEVSLENLVRYRNAFPVLKDAGFEI